MRVLTFLLFIWSASAFAEETFYLELAANGVMQSVADDDFTLASTELRAGYYIVDMIALEAFAGVGVLEDSVGDANQSMPSLYGINTRFESPSRDGTKAFIVLGYSSTDLELSRKSSGQVLAEDTFDGFSYGIGLEEALSKTNPIYLNLRWQRHYSAGDITIDSLGVALRYAL